LWTDVNASTESIDWPSLRQFDARQYEEYQEFIDNLNRMNPPIQTHIAPDTD
jgi:hypothetical protein